MAESIYQAFQTACDQWGERDFLFAPSEALGGTEPYRLSYAQARREVERLRESYAGAGYGAGHRIGMALDNHPVFFCHFLALNALGASIVPLNTAAQGAEIAHNLNSAEPALILGWAQHHAAMRDACAMAGRTLPIIAPGDAVPVVTGGNSPGGRDAETAMLFTSGTTGQPKGCILSNGYFLAAGELYVGLGGYCAFVPGEDRIVTPLPLTHMNALAVSFMAAMMAGACLIQLDRFHASTWWKTIRETGATVIHYLGVMPAILLQAPEGPADREGLKVRFGFGAGVDPRHHARFEARFGFPLIEAWAMTETGGGAWITANVEPRHVGTRCFGRLPDGLEARIVDEQGSDVAVGEPGELLVRAAGPDPRRNFFTAYHRDDKATAEAWEGGWFHTGDVVRQDAEGSFYFVDRNKNIVRRSGENIAAVEVEGALLQHPAVGGCAVLPVLDEIRGEEVMALIVARNPTEADAGLAEALVRHCLDTLVYFKAPGYVAFVDALPTTASQKVQRGTVRQLGRALHESGKAFDFRHLKRKGKGAA